MLYETAKTFRHTHTHTHTHTHSAHRVSLNSLGPFCRKAGFSLIEILTTLGILTIVSGISIFAYMKHYDKAQFLQFYMTGQNFGKAVTACLLKYENPQKCANMGRLRFKCDICRGNNVWFYKPAGTTKIMIEMETDKYRSTAVWRKDSLPTLAVRIQEQNGTDLKFCSYIHTGLDGNPIQGYGNGSVKLPFRKCQNNNDCKTGEQCHQPRFPHWVGDPRIWEIIP